MKDENGTNGTDGTNDNSTTYGKCGTVIAVETKSFDAALRDSVVKKATVNQRIQTCFIDFCKVEGNFQQFLILSSGTYFCGQKGMDQCKAVDLVDKSTQVLSIDKSLNHVLVWRQIVVALGWLGYIVKGGRIIGHKDDKKAITG